MEKLFRKLKVKGWWEEDGFADVEWWEREGDMVNITKERIPFGEFINLQYLYREVKLKDIQLYKDE